MNKTSNTILATTILPSFIKKMLNIILFFIFMLNSTLLIANPSSPYICPTINNSTSTCEIPLTGSVFVDTQAQVPFDFTSETSSTQPSKTIKCSWASVLPIKRISNVKIEKINNNNFEKAKFTDKYIIITLNKKPQTSQDHVKGKLMLTITQPFQKLLDTRGYGNTTTINQCHYSYE